MAETPEDAAPKPAKTRKKAALKVVETTAAETAPEAVPAEIAQIE